MKEEELKRRQEKENQQDSKSFSSGKWEQKHLERARHLFANQTNILTGEKLNDAELVRVHPFPVAAPYSHTDLQIEMVRKRRPARRGVTTSSDTQNETSSQGQRPITEYLDGSPSPKQKKNE